MLLAWRRRVPGYQTVCRGQSGEPWEGHNYELSFAHSNPFLESLAILSLSSHSLPIMRAAQTAAILAGLFGSAAAISLTGAAEGFAYGVTGGGDATPVYPEDNDELISYLGSDEPQVIVLSKTYDFTTGSTTTATGCAPYGTGAGCQLAINANNWCSSSAPSAQVTYYEEATEGITVASNKTIIGEGSSGILKGKGLRMTNGVSNIIIQNIEITDLNPQYVWGGDAFTFADSDLIWVDHCTVRTNHECGIHKMAVSNNVDRRPCSAASTTSLDRSLARGSRSPTTSSMVVRAGPLAAMATTTGPSSSSARTTRLPSRVSRPFHFDRYLNQLTPVTDNYITSTSGRGPALSGSTLFHAVNSVWSNISGHAIEGDTNGQGLFEGCVFDDVETIVTSDFKGHLFSSPSGSTSQCQSTLGRDCESNIYTSSGAFEESDTDFFSNFTGLTIADAESASSIQSSVVSNAGMGKLTQSGSSSGGSSSSSSAAASVKSSASTTAAKSSTAKASTAKSTAAAVKSSTTNSAAAKSTAVAAKSSSTTKTTAKASSAAQSTNKATAKTAAKEASSSLVAASAVSTTSSTKASSSAVSKCKKRRSIA